MKIFVQIFALGHYLFPKTHSFRRAKLSENCSLLGTDNVCRQTSEHIFAPHGGYSLYKAKKGNFTFAVSENETLSERINKTTSFLKREERQFCLWPLTFLKENFLRKS